MEKSEKARALFIEKINLFHMHHITRNVTCASVYCLAVTGKQILNRINPIKNYGIKIIATEVFAI